MDCPVKGLGPVVVWLIVTFLSTDAIYSGFPKRLCEDNSLRISNIGETGTISADLSTNEADFENPCVLRIEACSACQIEISPAPAKDFDFFCRTHLLQNSYCSLGCDYLHIFDMYYMNETTTSKYYQKWSEFNQPFQSESSNVFIMLCHGNSGRYNFSLNYKTIKKQREISGTFTDLYQNKGTISSPFFPRGYYLNHEVYEYIITGLQEEDRIMVVFDDWHLDPSSAIYYDDGSSVGSFTGGSLRPSLVTDTNQLRFMFHTGQSLSPTYGRRYMGFKATYSFHSSDSIIHKPVTSCKGSGTFFGKYGGHIEFLHTEVQRQLYDCVWVVKKQPGYSGIYLKITALKMIGYGKSGYIVIRDGLTSDSKVVGNVSVHESMKTLLPFRRSEGFYIRLTGYLSSSDTVEMAYASYIETPACHRDSGMFECDSRRCISNSLTCDGYDHCGDNSDEEKACGVFTPAWDQSYQYTITIGVIVPMVISVFLVMVICLLFVVIRRCRRHRMEQSLRSPDRIRTLSEDVSPTRTGNRRRRRHRRRMFSASADRDNPPTYDEAIQSPPSWYLNVGFSTPVDPNAPQPPPYSEAVENPTVTGLNQVPGSPTSSHSSQSEVTIDSRRHSVSSSSSEGGFRDWNSHESDGEGRRGRIGRHVSSSDDSEDDEQVTRPSQRAVNDVRNETLQSSTSEIVSESSRKGKSDNKPNGESSGGKEKSLKDKNTDITNVVESNFDDNGKVGAERKDSFEANRTANDLRNAIEPSSTERLNAALSHAGVSRDEVTPNTARPQLSTQRGISRSDGNLAQNREKPNRALQQGTRFSLASHALPEEDFTQNLVVDVDTNEIRVVYNGADDSETQFQNRERQCEAINRASPRRPNLLDESRERPRESTNRVSPRRHYVNDENSGRACSNRQDPAEQINQTRNVNRPLGSGNVNNSGVAPEYLSSTPDVRRNTQGQNVGRTASVNYIPMFIDGNPEDDIYV